MPINAYSKRLNIHIIAIIYIYIYIYRCIVIIAWISSLNIMMIAIYASSKAQPTCTTSSWASSSWPADGHVCEYKYKWINTHTYIYIYIYIRYAYLYIYICVCIEREREIHTYIYIYIYMYMYGKCSRVHAARPHPQ